MPSLTGLVTAVLTALHLTSTVRFVDQACDNAAAFLPSRVVGQDLALEIIINAVCEHVRPNYEPQKPLVMSVHGPPGVGKVSYVKCHSTQTWHTADCVL